MIDRHTERAARKRDEILDSAAELFARRGYQGTNMKLLSRTARASTSTIYSYFTDKSDLLRGAIDRRLDALETKQLELQARTDDPVEALLQGIALLNRTVADDPLLSGLMTYDAELTDVKLSVHARRVAQRIDAHSVALVERAVREGALEFDDPAPLVAVLRLAFQGWLLGRAHGEPGLEEADFTRTVKRIVLGLINDE